MGSHDLISSHMMHMGPHNLIQQSHGGHMILYSSHMMHMGSCDLAQQSHDAHGVM